MKTEKMQPRKRSPVVRLENDNDENSGSDSQASWEIAGAENTLCLLANHRWTLSSPRASPRRPR